MLGRPAFLGFLILLLTACGGGDDSAKGQGAREGREGLVVIEGDKGEVQVDVEIADDDRERQIGLMNRRSLPSDAGMVFLYSKDTTSGFWMKDTLIPLSIAFFNADGQIVRILDMEPCRADPCRIYEPGVAYRGALEVNQGAFARWGVDEGDRITVDRGG